MRRAENAIVERLEIPSTCRERFVPLSADAAQPLRSRHVILAGLSDLGSGYEVGRPEPFHHLLLYTVSGAAQLQTSDAAHRLGKGQVLIAPARLPYGYRISSRRWRIIWFHLADNEYWWALRQGELLIRPSYHIDNVLRAMEGHLSESLSDDHGAKRSALQFAEVLGSYLDRELNEDLDPVARKMHHRLYALWDHVNAHLQEPWSVARLAAHLHMSPVHFHRISMQYGGSSPMQMVTRLRLERAKELLTQDYPLKLIASLVGYQNPYAFSVAFKRYTGLSPRDYRREL